MTSHGRWSPAAERGQTRDPAATVNRHAAVLRDLHRPGAPLVLPNVWDCSSAYAMVAAGLPAVATSSAAIADSLGYRDGEAAPVGQMLDAVARIAAAVGVPVTADLERGYQMSPAELVERLAATGAAGCNLEDSDPGTGELVDAGRQADFLAAVRAAARERGLDLVLNARIDTHLRSAGDAVSVLDDTIRRARRYREAGADCVYPIGLSRLPAIAEVVAAAEAPVNILARGGAEPGRLAALGVARVSFGPYLYRAARDHLDELIAGYLADAEPAPRQSTESIDEGESR
ncbi:carboxyvinyl-carboxyphosphonate phosphorylmutase [Catellatospora methionotrophica]|uniref:Carboxyvinyl-carboxyphosphonate phosphorylmutase n=1 Tax=Catellatospora methionotrophica TaxID=121620 RepID=A0A8J3PIH3_9ACTN|nr:isocitrate lyase/phosphoenolpyruvate mutase family protein [Catellatospora methionotrophica]GIG16406.1 carboxyvinyl-carboxyphosphonate phosphorylmutase [Catellatospora methionotrophica]